MKLAILITYNLLIIGNMNAQGFGGVQIASEFSPNGNQLLLGGGAWVINNHFYLGGAGYGSVNTIITQEMDTLNITFGGLMLGYIHNMQCNKSIGLDMLIGQGGYERNHTAHDFFVVEPNLKFWYQFSDYIFGTIGIYYRLAYPPTEVNLPSNEFNRLGIRLTLNFGSLN